MAIIFDIERNSFVDGPGIRTTVFLKGCNLRCAWCHNPESQWPAPQMLYFQDKCTGCGKCEKVCPTPGKCTLCGRCQIFCPVDARKVCGKEYSVEEVWKEMEKDIPFYRNSGGGVTFSGGESMLQSDFLEEILKRCKENGIHTAVDTAGHVAFESFEKVLPYTDLFLYDIKCFDTETHRKYVGVGNERIKENLRKLIVAGANVWIRIPVVPGVNDSVEEMRQIRDFLEKCGGMTQGEEEFRQCGGMVQGEEDFRQRGGIHRVELLPYHAMGENKYRAIGMDPVVFGVPDAEKMEVLREIFR